MSSIQFADILAAQQRISPYIKKTPILSSSMLNQWLGHDIFFKAECMQTTGAFKLRGATNFLLKALENNHRPNKIVASSSGNHAQAVAYIGNKLGIPTCIYASESISPIKASATRAYGATLKLYSNRLLADEAVREAAQADHCAWIKPFNDADVVAGQGTVIAESLSELDNIDGIFAPCGGGGLLSGSLIAARSLSPHTQVIGTEPLAANDAADSLRQGKIVNLPTAPETLADGAATPAVGEVTFPYLQALDDFYEVNEEAIKYWTQWLHHILKVHVEPTCAMSMAAVTSWLAKQTSRKRVLVILSGGNISAQSMQMIWQDDYLSDLPSL
ncbi:serine/threonine dehydratase [Agaribacter flavus]|uniref:Serine/threonine dehydratase n=1 Tax=Agaribacter flavus TaxID=1902781 RepID=A0ABV7FPM5_9ALTE